MCWMNASVHATYAYAYGRACVLVCKCRHWIFYSAQRWITITTTVYIIYIHKTLVIRKKNQATSRWVRYMWFAICLRHKLAYAVVVAVLWCCKLQSTFIQHHSWLPWLAARFVCVSRYARNRLGMYWIVIIRPIDDKSTPTESQLSCNQIAWIINGKCSVGHRYIMDIKQINLILSSNADWFSSSEMWQRSIYQWNIVNR